MNSLLELAAHPVIGHRGASGSAPENTIEALDLALRQGADAFEIDVQLAGCGTPVLMHDLQLDRTTAATGWVRDRVAAELADLDAGHRFTMDAGRSFPWRGRGFGVPTLAEVLQKFPETTLLIELKTEEAADPVRRLLLEAEAVDRVVVASFLDRALEAFRAGPFHTAASVREIFGLWLRSKLGLGATPGSQQVYAVPDRYRGRVPVPTPRFVRAAREAGRPVHVWTVNESGRAGLLWRRGVSGIITNFPALLVAERNRWYPAEQRP